MKRARYYDDDDDEEEEERPTHRLMIRTRNNDEIVYPSSPKSEGEDSIDRIITAMYDEIYAEDRARALDDRSEYQAWLRQEEEKADLRVHARYARQFYESEDELWDGIYAPTPINQTRYWGSQESDAGEFIPIPGVRFLPMSDTEDETLPNQVVDDQDIVDNFPNAYAPTQVVTQDDDDDTASQTGDALDIAREYARRAFEE